MNVTRSRVRGQIMLVVIALISILIVFQLTFRLPALRHLADLEQTREQIAADLERERGLIDEAAGLELEVERQREIAAEYSLHIPSSIWLPGLLAYLEDLALQSGGMIESIKMTEPEPAEFLYRMRVQLQVAGSYDSHLALTEAIEQLPLVIEREGLLIMSENRGLTGQYQFAIVIDPDSDSGMWLAPVVIDRPDGREDPFGSAGGTVDGYQ